MLLHDDVVEPRVFQCFVCADAQLGPQLQHALKQVDASRIDLWQDLPEILRRVEAEGGLVLGKLGNAGPRAFGRRPHDAEYPGELILVGRAGEQRPAGVHLSHDAARRPNVDARIVGPAAEENVRRAIPQGDDLVGKGVDGDTKSAGQSEVAELELPFTVDQKVLGLEITVEDAVLVAEVDAPQQLVHEGLGLIGLQGAPVAVCVHVLLKVAVEELEDEHELVLCVDHVVEGDDVFVLELFHQGDLADGRGWSALFRVEVYFLEGNELARLSISAFEDLQRRCEC